MLTTTQFNTNSSTSTVYLALLTHGEMDKTMLITRTGYCKKTVTDALILMLKCGMIIRRMDPKDGRVMLFRLVEA